MATANTLNILKASNINDSSGARLELIVQPQPTTVNGTQVTSPYSMLFVIPTPTAAQLSKYVYGAQITLTSDT